MRVLIPQRHLGWAIACAIGIHAMALATCGTLGPQTMTISRSEETLTVRFIDPPTAAQTDSTAQTPYETASPHDKVGSAERFDVDEQQGLSKPARQEPTSVPANQARLQHTADRAKASSHGDADVPTYPDEIVVRVPEEVLRDTPERLVLILDMDSNGRPLKIEADSLALTSSVVESIRSVLAEVRFDRLDLNDPTAPSLRFKLKVAFTAFQSGTY